MTSRSHAAKCAVAPQLELSRFTASEPWPCDTAKRGNAASWELASDVGRLSHQESLSCRQISMKIGIKPITRRPSCPFGPTCCGLNVRQEGIEPTETTRAAWFTGGELPLLNKRKKRKAR